MNEELYRWMRGSYVLTPYLEELILRAQRYLNAGLPLHLRGAAGVGKTSLALYLAGQRERPVYLVYGNEAFQGFDLAGRVIGERRRLVVDQFVRRVTKRTEESEGLWEDAPLIKAVREGGTLIYDEFTRSRPEANNLLLSILEEGVVEVPAPRRGPRLIQVHPDFRAIFTSNPAEYVGVHQSTDALHDRMVSLDMTGRDFATDVAIVAGACGLTPVVAAAVVTAVQKRLAGGQSERDPGSLRPAIMVGRVVEDLGILADEEDPLFQMICTDIVGVGRAREAEE